MTYQVNNKWMVPFEFTKMHVHLNFSEVLSIVVFSEEMKVVNKYMKYIPWNMHMVLLCSVVSENIEAETKWPPFHRRHLKVHFLKKISLKYVPYGSIDSRNGLAPNRWQAIIWSNVSMFHWRMYASFGFNELLMDVCDYYLSGLLQLL